MALPVVAGSPSRPIPTLYEFARARLSDAHAPREQHGIDRYETAYRLRIHEHLGELPVDQITVDHVEAWCDQMIEGEGYRRCTVYAYRTLHWLLNQAVERRHIHHNAASAIKFDRRYAPQIADDVDDWDGDDDWASNPPLTMEQYQLLKATAARGGLESLVRIRLITEGALRRAEALALRFGNFNHDQRTYRVRQAVTQTRSTGRVVGKTKTRASRRHVVLAPDLCDLISQYILEYPWEVVRAGFLFPGEDAETGRRVSGRPLAPHSLTQWTKRLIIRAGLVDEAGKPLTTLQGLRATGATIASSDGVPLPIVQAQLGHRGRSVAEQHYINAANDLAARRRFADVFAEQTVTVTDEVDQKVDQKPLLSAEEAA